MLLKEKVVETFTMQNKCQRSVFPQVTEVEQSRVNISSAKSKVSSMSVVHFGSNAFNLLVSAGKGSGLFGPKQILYAPKSWTATHYLMCGALHSDKNFAPSR